MDVSPDLGPNRQFTMDIFRKALLQPGPPDSFALQTVQEAIKPQKHTKLILDENQLLENILRTLLQELVSSAVQAGEQIMQYGQSIDDGETCHAQIPRLLGASQCIFATESAAVAQIAYQYRDYGVINLDGISIYYYIVLYLCEKEHVEGGMIFQLLEDLTEMSTMQNCKDIFGYIESKQDILGKQELFARGKLVMLRTCNQLLRRLSKANDVVLCGRILMFLAHFFPLSERSAVNIKGVFNTSNETKYEKEAPDGISIDFNFYKTFWSLQEYFCNPPSLTNAPMKWQKFYSSLMDILNTFEAQPLTDEEGMANDLEEDAATFSIKYLTSSKLMGLELKDPSFRRYVLVQSLILFDYLKAPGKADKDVPSEGMKEEIKSCEEHVKKMLELTPPNGKEFLRKVDHILEREKNWVWWKRDGCPPFEKPPIEKKIGLDGARKRPRWRLGNKELSQLWKWADQNPNALTDPERICTPPISEYWKPLAEDMDVTAGIEEEYHHKNNRVYCWKGLRFAARQDLEGFSRFTDFGIEGVVPVELLPPDLRSKYQAKPSDKSKRPKKEDAKGTQMEDQMTTPVSENDGEGAKADNETAATPMDSEAGRMAKTSNNAAQVDGSILEENQTQGSDDDASPEAGQIEPDTEVEGDPEAECEIEDAGVEGDPEADL